MAIMVLHYNINSFSIKGLGFTLGLFLLLNLKLYSNNEYIGTIITSDSRSISYSINFKIDSFNHIKGYTISNIGSQDETKSLLSGSLNPKSGVIQFVEYKVLSTKSKVSLNDMCFIQFNGKLNKIKDNKIIVGKYIGYYPNKRKCSEGSINLVSKENAISALSKLKEELSKDTNLLTKNKIDPSVQTELKSIKNEFPDKVVVNNNGSETKISWKSDTVVFKLWDQDRVDNDRVKIVLNDEVYRKDVKLSDENSYTLVIPFKGKIMKIEFIAINEGFFPPNTSKILFIDMNKKYYYQNNLNEKKSTIYNIIKE